MAISVDPDQTAPIGAVCSGSTLFASILNSSVMLGNYLQQTTSVDDIFRCIFFHGALSVKRTVGQCKDQNTCDICIFVQLREHNIKVTVNSHRGHPRFLPV